MAAPSFPWRQNVPRNRPCSASEAKWVRTGETYKKKLSNWEHLPATALADAPLYTWAANIAHLDDENVKVDESLKDIDLDLSANSLASLLGGGAGKALLKSEPQDIDGFEKGSLSSRKKDLANNCLWDYEDFTWNGLQVRRIKLDWAIARRATWDSTKGEEDFAGYKNQYKKSEVARHVALQVSKDENRPPKATDAEILNIMAMMLEELGGIKNVKNRVSLRKDNARWRKLCQLAQGWWYRNYRNQSLDQVPGEEDFPPHSSCTEWRDEVLRNKSKFSTTLNDNKYAAWLEDQYIGENACLQCNQDIVIIRDAHDELVAGAVVEATQRLFPAGVNVAERMTEAIRRFTWRYPTSMPDPIRHPTNEDDHLILNPKLDVRNTGITMQEAHEAVCSTDHYGIRFPIGHSDPKDLTFANFGQNSTNNKKVPISTAWTEEFPKLRTGAWGIAVKELRLTLKAWDEGLYNDYIEIRKWLPQKYLWETGNGDMPYYFMAQLCGVQTEGHTDKSDWIGGLAGLKTFGNYTGGDLVLKELGIRMRFPSGSHCHLRGHELHHYVMPYQGNRNCFVFTNHESVRQAGDTMKNRQNTVWEDYEKLNSTFEKYNKDYERLTEEERPKLRACHHQLETTDTAQVIDYLYRSCGNKLDKTPG